MSLRPVGLESCLPFNFTNRSKMTLDNYTLAAGKTLTVLSIKSSEGEDGQVRCNVRGEQGASAEVCIPLNYRGEFYECENQEHFTLQEIMSSPCLRCRKFRFTNTTKGDRPLVFSPIYQVQAIMNCENNLLFLTLKLSASSFNLLFVCKLHLNLQWNLLLHLCKYRI